LVLHSESNVWEIVVLRSILKTDILLPGVDPTLILSTPLKSLYPCCQHRDNLLSPHATVNIRSDEGFNYYLNRKPVDVGYHVG
jgi:hypothetical protein